MNLGGILAYLSTFCRFIPYRCALLFLWIFIVLLGCEEMQMIVMQPDETNRPIYLLSVELLNFPKEEYGNDTSPWKYLHVWLQSDHCDFLSARRIIRLNIYSSTTLFLRMRFYLWFLDIFKNKILNKTLIKIKYISPTKVVKI